MVSISNVLPIFVLFIYVFDEGAQASCPTVVSRAEWGAQPAKSRQNLPQHPAPYVVIHHSETPTCDTIENCKRRVKNIQSYHINTKNWDDIGYNFLIGGDGNVYEGRGWNTRGAHVPKYNARSIGICMIGNFQNIVPNTAQMEALNNLISCGVEKNEISSSYQLIGHRQGKATQCPGDALYNEVTKMPHWSSNPN